ncbi:hypothetical protein BP6252_13330 [Coleophoma cylindrospora]|uniref:Uncharacterized protein n=1 Tax=Coleophoma cylindrospora TaxID=1849047 RepID=A0A3D8QBL4_9HELO|nr:hypothetical protein BP6252_13330 [Coleophoma cylindrospora]
MRIYESIHALLICWDKSIDEFKNQRDSLGKVLRDFYGFNISPLNIPLSENADQWVRTEISNFMRDPDKKQNLLIIYYGGHATLQREKLFLQWSVFHSIRVSYAPSQISRADTTRHSSFDKPEDPCLNWSLCQESLVTGAKADILIILDCCHAGAAFQLEQGQQDNAVELLPACGIEDRAFVGEHSLTNRLIRILKSPTLYQKAFPTYELQRQLAYLQKSLGIVHLIDGKSNPWGRSAHLITLIPRYDGKGISIHRVVLPDSDDEEEQTPANREPDLPHRESGYQLQRDASLSYTDAGTNTEVDITQITDPILGTALFLDPRRKVVYVDVGTETIPVNTVRPDHKPVVLQQQQQQQQQEQQQQRRPLIKNDCVPRTSSPILSADLDITSNFPHKRRMHESVEARQTGLWMDRYSSFLHEWSPDKDGEAYKIAILSTGLNMEDLYIGGQRRRIVDRRNFVGTESEILPSTDSTPDRDSIGTSHFSLLAQTSKYTNFFISKISESGIFTDISVVVRAIACAIDEWKVNMLVLPFGLNTYNQELADQLSRALQANIICLAATGNSGANARAAYPARMPGVVAVFSSDSLGNPSLFNPSPSPAQRNFSTIGEDIAISHNGEEQYRSGTSFATCVMAGILSSMFVFARDYLELDLEDWNLLHTPAGAHKFLEIMSTSRGGYDYVAPWLLLSDDLTFKQQDGSQSSYKMVVKAQILAALRQLR